MISRKEQYKRSVLETFITTYLTKYIAGITPDQLTYVDEIYQILANRIGQMSRFNTVRFWPIDQWDHVTSKYYQTFIGDTRRVSEFVFQALPELYAEMEALANQVIDISEGLAKRIAGCDVVAKAAEGVLKRKATLTSIKDEIIAYDTISDQTLVVDGTLAIDRRSGSITLGVDSEQPIVYTIKDIRVDKPKGEIKWNNIKIGDPTWRNITNGYFTSRTFGDSPLFESTETADPSRMVDGDLETSFMIEYNSFAEESLAVTYELECSPIRVDALELTFDPSDGTRSLGNALPLPELTMLKFRLADGKIVDMTDMVTNNIITIKGSPVGKREGFIEHHAPDPFPVGSFLTNVPQVVGVLITLRVNAPQETSYIEKVVRDEQSTDIKQFNYFETLVLNKYDPPAGYYDPRGVYSARDLAELASQLYSNLYLMDKHIPLNRYAIVIKELKLLQRSYISTGEAFTKDLNATKRKIAGMDLFVNEVIPGQCAIKYYVSPDRNTWYEIVPQTRADSQNLPRRILLSADVLPEHDDVVALCETSSIYMKIEMIGTGQKTPILKSYAARIKLI